MKTVLQENVSRPPTIISGCRSVGEIGKKIGNGCGFAVF